MRPIFAVPILFAVLTAVGCGSSPTVSEVTTPEPTETVVAEPEVAESEVVESTTTDVATPNEPAAEVATLPAVYTQQGVAIAGADPVAYFTAGAYVPGSAEFTHDWSGATWQFASAENRDAFAVDPAAYAPQYGGFCAWAVSQGYTAAVDPEAWKIVDGKLYLNYDKNIQARWERDIPGNIAKADANWPTVAAEE
jgi:YHS domain-containing protein